MAKIFRDLLILVAVFGGIVMAYVFVNQQFPGLLTIELEKTPDWAIISKEDEKSIGEVFIDELLENQVLISDSFVLGNMQTVYNRLLESSQLSDTAVTFYIVRSSTVNALTLPGGNIVLFTGLMELCETPEQLSAVIAHELGHVYHEHVMEKLMREVGMNVLLTIVTGGDPSVIHELSALLVSNVFSREHETEADAFALSVLTNAKIDPHAMGEFFELLNSEDLSYAESLEWFMSHPHNDKRIQMSENHPLPASFEEEPFDIDWSELQDRI